MHFRGGHGIKQRSLRTFPRPVRRHAHVLYRVASLKWLRGALVMIQKAPANPETWELGVAVPPRYVEEKLTELGFQDVRTMRDTDYDDGRRLWVLGQKRT